jgi:hypothetical protein
MSPMRELLEKILSEAPPPADGGEPIVEAQIYFKHSFVIPTPRGPVPSSVAAGALRRGPVEGTYMLLTIGDDPNRGKVMVESIFEAETVCRIDRAVGKAEEPLIARPNGRLVTPGA